MAVAVVIHLAGGLAAILQVRRRLPARSRHPTLQAPQLLVGLFAALLLLHLMQVMEGFTGVLVLG